MNTTDELTFGQRLVGITFNPSGDPQVNRAKEICAELADMVNDLEKSRGSSGNYLYNLIKGDALRAILHAQMAVVKLLTLPK